MIPPRVQHQLDKCGAVRAERLSGDASTRTYYRIWTKDGNHQILVDYGEAFETERLPYLRVARLLEAYDDFHTPRIHEILPDEGFLVLEDVGDETLYQRLRTKGYSSVKHAYYQAVELAFELQQQVEAEWIPLFGKERMLDELRFFFKNFFEKYHGCDIKSDQPEALLAEAAYLVERIECFPHAFSHRDFHSRNLILFEGKIILLDFQDAFRGPYVYDLVSLLLDPYANLSQEPIDQLSEHYFLRQRYQPDGERFRREFCFVGVQRLLKALGTYAYLAAERNLSFYEPFIPVALKRVQLFLEELEELIELRLALAHYIGDAG